MHSGINVLAIKALVYENDVWLIGKLHQELPY